MNMPAMMLLTVGAYLLGVWVKNKTRISLLHPFLICIPVIIAVLLLFDIPADYYKEANKPISFMLSPCVVALGYLLYENVETIKKYWLSITSAVVVGSVVGVFSVILIGKLFGLDADFILALEPKSVTMPIALDITSTTGANAAITAASVFLCGFIGALIGTPLLNLLHIKNPVARGAGFGCASHGVGTARAIEEGAVQGAVSGLCIALMGLATAILIPLIN